MAYLRRVKRPLLGRFGYDLSVDVERTGFYPAGGGVAAFEIGPSTPTPLDLDGRGTLAEIAVYSKASEDLADAEVAERQARRAEERLADEELPAVVESVEYVPSQSPGSAILLGAAFDRTLAGFDRLGERGKPAEDVADDAVDRLLAFHAGPGTVDRFMADQLLVPLALEGGRVRAPTVTDHVESNVEVIERFGFDIATRECDDGAVLLEAPV